MSRAGFVLMSIEQRDDGNAGRLHWLTHCTRGERAYRCCLFVCLTFCSSYVPSAFLSRAARYGWLTIIVIKSLCNIMQCSSEWPALFWPKRFPLVELRAGFITETLIWSRDWSGDSRHTIKLNCILQPSAKSRSNNNYPICGAALLHPLNCSHLFLLLLFRLLSLFLSVLLCVRYDFHSIIFQARF